MCISLVCSQGRACLQPTRHADSYFLVNDRTGNRNKVQPALQHVELSSLYICVSVLL